MKKIIKILKICLYFLTVFSMTFVACYSLSFLLSKILIDIKIIISENTLLIFTLIVSLILSLYIGLKLKSTLFYYYNQRFIFLNSFLIIMGIKLSLKPSLELTIERAEELIRILWTLFAILSAILVAWTVSVRDQFSYIVDFKDPIGKEQRLHNINNKIEKSNKTIEYFCHLLFVAIPMSSALLLTPNIFVMKDIDYVIQTIIYTCFYITPFNIIMILIDLLGPTLIALGQNVIGKEEVSDLNAEIKKGEKEDSILLKIEEKDKQTCTNNDESQK